MAHPIRLWYDNPTQVLPYKKAAIPNGDWGLFVHSLIYVKKLDDAVGVSSVMMRVGYLGDVVDNTAARSANIYIPYTITSPVSESMDLVSSDIDKSILNITEIYTDAILKVNIPLGVFKSISSEMIMILTPKRQFRRG